MKFSLKRTIRPILILIAAVVVAIIMVKGRTNLPAEPGPLRLPYVELQTIELADQDIVVRAHGTLISSQVLKLASEVAGAVVWVSDKYNVGEYVEAGEELIKIQSIPYELALAQAEASLASAKLALADAKALQRTARIVEAKANIKVAEQLVRKATLDLAKTTVKAPFNAILDSAPLEIAEYLTPGKLVSSMMGTDVGEIHMPLTQSDAVYLVNHKSSNVEIKRSINGQTESWQGRFERIEGRMDQQTRVLNAVVEVDQPYTINNGHLPLVFGAFVEVDMRGSKVPGAALLPQLSIHSGPTVYVFEEGKIRKRGIEVVHSDGRGNVVVKGLKTGERVVINRLETMYDSLPVAVKDEQ